MKDTGQNFILGLWGVRYQVKDVERSIAFYTQLLGFHLDHQALHAFGQVSIDDLRVAAMLQMTRKRQQRQREARFRPCDYARVHEQDAMAMAHDSLGCDFHDLANSISIGKLYLSRRQR